MRITQTVCAFVALRIQHAMRMHRIIMRPAPHYTVFPHYLTNGTFFFRKKIIEHKMYVLSSPTTLSVICFIIRRIERDMFAKMYIGLHVK